MNAPAPKTPARGAPAAGLAASLAASLAAGLRRLRARLARPDRVSPAPPRRAQGVLAVLIAVLFLSGGVRLYLGLDAARALGGADGAGAQATEASAAEPAGCAPPPAEVARALSAREDALVAAELRMAEREAALALGELAMPAETDELAAEASAALWNYYRKGKDQQARFFCLVALGRIGGTANREDLLRELGRARKGTEKPWVALALGLIGWDSRQTMGVVDQTLGHALQKELADTANDEFRAACSIALGLTGYTDASRDLIAMLDKYEFHDMVAGYISVGLALLPEQAARAEIRRIIHRATLQPIVVVQGAIAIALLGRGEAGQELHDLWVSGE